jgi:hypothetical protein
LLPSDNDLDVDVLAVAIMGNGDRGGWPIFQIQCATGAIQHLEMKIAEGATNFATVWENGFFPGTCVRGAATPDDLISLNSISWSRLGQAGLVLDRTRLAYLSRSNRHVPVPKDVMTFWRQIWTGRDQISWQTGWQQIA